MGPFLLPPSSLPGCASSKQGKADRKQDRNASRKDPDEAESESVQLRSAAGIGMAAPLLFFFFRYRTNPGTTKTRPNRSPTTPVHILLRTDFDWL